MSERSDLQWNKEEIASHLKSAVDTLTPNVFDKIDLQTPQDIHKENSRVIRLYRRMRTAAVVAAACFCAVTLAGGVSLYQNSRVESFIGIDVNPSIELSVNRNDKVLKAEALNDDGAEILDDMELKNVKLNIAVNAVIGSMVRHGYLDELDNAILVTVSNEDSEKAAALRQDVVGDIENSLEEHKLKAVVYDQQLAVTDEVEQIAKEYGISYGKAYFLQELVEENNLSDEDMELFAGMTMEKISKEIAERSYNVRKDDYVNSKETSLEQVSGTQKMTSAATAAVDSTGSSEVTTDGLIDSTAGENSSSATQTTQAPTSTAASENSTEESQEESTGGKAARIDYVDFDGNRLNVVFKDKVKWKSPTISVKDENGESYSAKITDTSPDSCEIEISGLPGGMSCTFSLGGVAAREGGAYKTVKGYFDTPDIADGVTEGSEAPEETEEPGDHETTPTTAPETTASEPETDAPESTAASDTEAGADESSAAPAPLPA